MSNYLLDKMNELDADGIDFVPICLSKNPPIWASYIKEEFRNVNGFPKSNYRYWKIVNGENNILMMNRDFHRRIKCI